ncbi:MAG TPA: hypothetical protein VMU02_10970 [bacterium]|nr:hypothetical protein [bacterium]
MLAAFGRTAIVVFAILGVIAAIAAILLNSCAPARVYVRAAPPAPRQEVIPPRPGPAAIWMDGQWAWNGHEYVWISGHWETRPRGTTWVPGHWARTRRGWVYVDGRWVK